MTAFFAITAGFLVGVWAGAGYAMVSRGRGGVR